MGKHLRDETAEFRMPTLGRHAAEDHADDTAENKDDELEATQRFDPGFRRAAPGTRPPAPGNPPAAPGTRREDDAGAR